MPYDGTISEQEYVEELRERIAKTLGWTVNDTKMFGLSMLATLVRDKDPELCSDIRLCVEQKLHWFGSPQK